MFRFLFVLAMALTLLACSGDSTTSCDGYDAPDRQNSDRCDEPGIDPRELGVCLKGSGYAGQWSVDADGLPFYDLRVEERCDGAGRHDNPLGRGPVHLIGNGRGLQAIAHASGAVEVFSTDRVHKWLNHVDTWDDEDSPERAKQVGGGWSYLVKGDDISSTRHADLVIGGAADAQVRRLGVGYYETQTLSGDVLVRRRVFAPDTDTRAVVAEVSVSNLGMSKKSFGLVEYWDVNIHQLSDAFAENYSPSNTVEIERQRRVNQDLFKHNVSWSQERRIAVVSTEANELPESVQSPGDASRLDYFVDPVFLAVIDQGPAPEAVWLTNDELWGAGEVGKGVPKRLAKSSPNDSRDMDIFGADQAAVLALRVPMELPPGATITRRFAFGSVLAEQTAEQAADELRARSVELSQNAAARWKDRLVWAVFQGQEDAGLIQRELAWSSYYLQAGAAFDRQRNLRYVSQAGAHRFFYGLDGAIGDLAVFAEALSLIDHELAAETLLYALSTQHGTETAENFRFPYATVGVDSFDDVFGNNQRSDVYFLLPAAMAQYVAFSRDTEFWQRPALYWPLALREFTSVGGHLERMMIYVNGALGRGGRGLLAMGTSDYSDGLLEESTSVFATPKGTGSAVNSLFVAQRFELLADQLEPVNGPVSAGIRDLWTEQTPLLEDEVWNGSYYYRGFADEGGPFLDEYIFALPQALAILARTAVGARADGLLDLLDAELGTTFGSRADSGVASDGTARLGHVRPAVSGWISQAYASADSERGFAHFRQSLLSTHAEQFPGLWYGIWTGAESYQVDGDTPGHAGESLVSAFGEMPGLNLHHHAGPIRALYGVLGLSPMVGGIRVRPNVPGETFNVVLPTFTLFGTPGAIGGSVILAIDEPMTLEVLVPSGLRATALVVRVNGQGVTALQDGNLVTLALPSTPGTPVSWSITAQ